MLKQKYCKYMIKSAYGDKLQSKIKNTNRKKRLNSSHKYKSKQNNQYLINNTIKHSPIKHNKQLIKTIAKPNKINFVNKISQIYDLLLANIKIPQSAQYFLGQAIYQVNYRMKSSYGISEVSCQTQKFTSLLNSHMKWKFDDFKKCCLKIYENSDQEDLKAFMKLQLPALNRWCSDSLNNSLNKTRITHGSILIDENQVLKNKGSRIQYFKNLTRKASIKSQLKDGAQQYDAVDRMTDKVNAYLIKYKNKLPTSDIID